MTPPDAVHISSLQVLVTLEPWHPSSTPPQYVLLGNSQNALKMQRQRMTLEDIFKGDRSESHLVAETWDS